MLSYLLDTHVLVWWQLSPEKLSSKQNRVLLDLESCGEPVGVSAITLWELAKMVEHGKQELSMPLDSWLSEVESHPMIEVLPLSPKIAAESVQLGYEFHKDPADQIIVATARCLGLRLLTSDERIRDWGRVPVI